jgi:hypothetical protein
MAAILRDLVGGRTVRELRQVLLEDLQPNAAVRGILPDSLLCERSGTQALPNAQCPEDTRNCRGG